MSMCSLRLPGVCALIFSCGLAGDLDAQIVSRGDYGARFEPPGLTIHGAGQMSNGSDKDMGREAFYNYSDTLGPDRLPLTFMWYLTIRDADDTDLIKSNIRALKVEIEALEQQRGHWVMPQIGLQIPTAGMNDSYNDEIDTLADELRALERPVYLRIGYEINGTWYSPMYQAGSYISAFQRVTDRLRAKDAPVATLWNSYPGYTSGTFGQWSYIEQFYPGDVYVDWISYDTFSTHEANFEANGALRSLLDFAASRGKPVMIGEATPRYNNVADPGSITWFEQFFTTINKRPELKGHTYINWNWAGTQWPDWGDARIEMAHPTVLSTYLGVMGRTMFAHGGPISPYWAANPRADAVWQWESLTDPDLGTATTAYLDSMAAAVSPSSGTFSFVPGRFGRAVRFSAEGRYSRNAVGMAGSSTNTIAFWFRPTVTAGSGNGKVIFYHPLSTTVEGSSRFVELVLNTTSATLELRVRNDTSPSGNQSTYTSLVVPLADIGFSYDRWNLITFAYRARPTSGAMALGGNGVPMATLDGLGLQPIGGGVNSSSLIRFGTTGDFDSAILINGEVMPADYFLTYWQVPRPFEPYASALYPLDRDGDGGPDTWETGRGLDPNRPDTSGDADQNGLPDLVDFTLGLAAGQRPDPADMTFSLANAAGTGPGDYLTLDVAKAPEAASLSLGVEVSGDLSIWSSSPADVEVIEDSTTRFLARDRTPASSAGRRFIRLTVSPPDPGAL